MVPMSANPTIEGRLRDKAAQVPQFHVERLLLKVANEHTRAFALDFS